MSSVPALRTYTFSSAAAARQFRSFFKLAVVSLSQNHGVQTTGVFLSEKNPAQILTLVRYPGGKVPQEVMRSYVTSEAFKKDLEGLNKEDIVGVDEVILEAVDV